MTNKYNDGLNNETEVQIISTYRRPYSQRTKDIISDLGTYIGPKDDNVEMYYNYNCDKEVKSNCKTFQQELAANVLAPTARTSSEVNPSEEEEKKKDVFGLLGGVGSTSQPISTVPGFVRLNPHVLYDRISVQIGNLREMGRYKRCNVYISLKQDTDNDFTVFLTGAATTSHSELKRGCKNSQTVQETIDAMITHFPNIMIARLRYKSLNGYITDFHKKLTKSAVIGIVKENDMYVAIFSLYQEFYRIPLDVALSKNQIGKYIAHGVYQNELQEFDDE